MEKDLRKLSSKYHKKKRKSSKKKVQWFDLPYDVRFIIIDMLDERSKLCYLLCSDDCAADMPKSYFFKKLRFHDSVGRFSSLRMCMDYHDMILKTSHRSSCLVSYGQNPGWKEKQNQEVVFANYFRRLLWNTSNLESFEFPLTNSRGLSSLLRTTSIQSSKSLKKLDIKLPNELNLFECGFIDFEQLRNITDSIFINCMLLELSQVKQLKSSYIGNRSGKMTSEHVNYYFKSFVNGEVHENVKKLQFFNDGAQKFQGGQLIDDLEVIRLRKTTSRISFALVCTVNNIRIAVVECAQNEVTIQLSSKYEFKKGYDYLYYGIEVDEFLQNHS